MKNNKIMNNSKKNKTHTDKHGKSYFEERLVDDKNWEYCLSDRRMCIKYMGIYEQLELT